MVNFITFSEVKNNLLKELCSLAERERISSQSNLPFLQNSFKLENKLLAKLEKMAFFEDGLKMLLFVLAIYE